jgi:hypothetical protein
VKTYKFVKTGHEWYIDLPEFLTQGGSIGDLQMVDGSDKMLDMIAGENGSVELDISLQDFEAADILLLTEKCDPYIGGGYYVMPYYQGIEINKRMWLCQVTAFLFGEIPGKIYVKRHT